MIRLVLLFLALTGLVTTVVQSQESEKSPEQTSAQESTLVMIEEGMYTHSWFLNSFLELREDLNDSMVEDKALVVIWTQKGCIYCEKLQKLTISDPKVNAYMRAHFNVVQLNKYGGREVTDFDGETLPENVMARKFRVAYTPTIQFFVAEKPSNEGDPVDIEALNIPGYLPPEQFYNLLEFVKERRFKKQSLISFLKEAEGTLER